VLALIISDALLVALGANAVAALAHLVSHFIDRDLGCQPSYLLTIGLFAVVLLGFTRHGAYARFRIRSHKCIQLHITPGNSHSGVLLQNRDSCER
jgi:hypothetical protein